MRTLQPGDITAAQALQIFAANAALLRPLDAGDRQDFSDCTDPANARVTHLAQLGAWGAGTLLLDAGQLLILPEVDLNGGQLFKLSPA